MVQHAGIRVDKHLFINALYVQFPALFPAQRCPHAFVLYCALGSAETGLTSNPYFSSSLWRLRSSYPGGRIAVTHVSLVQSSSKAQVSGAHTSSLANLSNSLLQWPPPVLAQVLFPVELFQILCLSVSLYAAAGVVHHGEDQTKDGTDTDDSGHATGC